MKQFFFLASVAAILMVADAQCPKEHLNQPMGCAYMQQCFGSSCGAGHLCCPHICGDRCVKIVHCDPVDCGNLRCQYGLDRDSRGCDTCTCRTSPRCTGLLCALQGTLG